MRILHGLHAPSAALVVAAVAAAGFVLALGVAVPPARAETRDARTVALGWMTENADAVVLGRAAEERVLGEGGNLRERDLLVDESLRGSVAAGTSITVVVEGHGEELPWAKGAVHLAFLRRIPVPAGTPARWAPVSGPFALRAIPAEGPESRFPAHVRSLVPLLDESGAVAKPDGLREFLVAGMEDADPGIAWSDATDFLRHGELHAGLSEGQAARVVAAFRRQPVGKRTKDALALAVAAVKDPGATRALVDALDDPQARLVRTVLGEALRRRGDPAASRLLVARLVGGTPEGRADALKVLGIAGAVDAAPAVRARLADPAAGVRAGAAEALGLLARAAREADPAARLEGTADLAKIAEAKGSDGAETRSALWALAQMDDAEAWSALRRLAAEDPREEVRRYAERYLRSPRQSLILE